MRSNVRDVRVHERLKYMYVRERGFLFLGTKTEAAETSARYAGVRIFPCPPFVTTYPPTRENSREIHRSAWQLNRKASMCVRIAEIEMDYPVYATDSSGKRSLTQPLAAEEWVWSCLASTRPIWIDYLRFSRRRGGGGEEQATSA